jgi:hypothetical protein
VVSVKLTLDHLTEGSAMLAFESVDGLNETGVEFAVHFIEDEKGVALRVTGFVGTETERLIEVRAERKDYTPRLDRVPSRR